MKSFKVLPMAILLSTFGAFGPGDLRAETVSQSNGVTTIRGVDDATTAAQRQMSRGRSGVAVFRGTSTAVRTVPDASEAPQPLQVMGGKNLWIYDPARNEVTACSLRYNMYGNRTVRCSSDRY